MKEESKTRELSWSQVLFTERELGVWRIKADGVLHVGGHLGEESKFYKQMGFGSVVWVEAIESKANELRKRVSPDDVVLNALVWNESGIIKSFNVATNGQSSSMLELGTHAIHHPGVAYESQIKLSTSRLDDLLLGSINFNFLNLDIQGVELQALEGLGSRLDDVDYVYTEVNKENVYDDCCLISDLDQFLRPRGFRRVATKWTSAGWGDALYVRKSVLRVSVFSPTLLGLVFWAKATLIPCLARAAVSTRNVLKDSISKIVNFLARRT